MNTGTVYPLTDSMPPDPAAGGMSPQRKVALALQAQRGLFKPSSMSGLNSMLPQMLSLYQQKQQAMPTMTGAAPDMNFNPLLAGQ